MVVHGDDYFLDDDLFPIVDDLLNNKSLGDGAATENTFSVSGCHTIKEYGYDVHLLCTDCMTSYIRQKEF